MKNRILFIITIIFAMAFSTLFAYGGGSNPHSAKDEAKRELSINDIKVGNDNSKYSVLISEVFKDTAKIAPSGRNMILVFGLQTCPYSDMLKKDIESSKELQDRLKDEFTSYYFDAGKNLLHKQFHEGEFMDVDTNTIIDVYGIRSTPTIIFTDKAGKAVIIVPGYMPAKQFLATMDFIEKEKWAGKDRKNGEVYEALRDYYLANGIEVIKK